jgi:hypothetical protein
MAVGMFVLIERERGSRIWVIGVARVFEGWLANVCRGLDLGSTGGGHVRSRRG